MGFERRRAARFAPRGLALAWLCLLGSPLAGCWTTPEGPDSPDPQKRLDWIVRQSRGLDADAVPELISFLEANDPAARMLAFRVLTGYTGGEAFGYHHADPPLQRQAAVDRWVEWAVQEGYVESSADVPHAR